MQESDLGLLEREVGFPQGVLEPLCFEARFDVVALGDVALDGTDAVELDELLESTPAVAGERQLVLSGEDVLKCDLGAVDELALQDLVLEARELDSRFGGTGAVSSLVGGLDRLSDEQEPIWLRPQIEIVGPETEVLPRKDETRIGPPTGVRVRAFGRAHALARSHEHRVLGEHIVDDVLERPPLGGAGVGRENESHERDGSHERGHSFTFPYLRVPAVPAWFPFLSRGRGNRIELYDCITQALESTSPPMTNESKSEINFGTACDALAEVLSGRTRNEIAAGTRLKRLRDAMRRHRFGAVALDGLVEQLDRLGQEDGFHVLHDWDGTVEKLNPETIPVDVLTFMLDKDVPNASETRVVAMLLDYYLMYVIALLTLRMWDTGNPNDNFDRLERLLRDLQGADGSGQKFADGVETLLLVAVSHYESDERAYDRLLAKIAALDRRHRLKLALVLAGIFGSHLRFGFEATYGRDIVKLRNDNGPDYPWLLFALATLMEAYDAGANDEAIVEGLVNGLSPDPRAFVGQAPDSLASHSAMHERFRSLFEKTPRRSHRPLRGPSAFAGEVLTGVVLFQLSAQHAESHRLSTPCSAVSRRMSASTIC